MPLARTYSVALVGVTGHVVEIEADIANGLPAVILVGLPDTALREARDRIRAAIVNSGEEWPQRKITVGLSPASLPKRGSWFDLAIAIGILAAAGKVPRAAAAGVMFFGELGLDGQAAAGLRRPARRGRRGRGRVRQGHGGRAERGGGRPGARRARDRGRQPDRGRRTGFAACRAPTASPAAVEYEGGQELPGRRAADPGARRQARPPAG